MTASGGTYAGTAPLLEVADLHVRFPLGRGVLTRKREEVQAVSGVSFSIRAGETLGLVGESGSGKTTTARVIAGLERASAGRALLDGIDVTSLRSNDLKRFRREVQMVFQDPYASLNPRMTARELLFEPWRIHRDVLPRSRWERQASTLMEMVGLNPDYRSRYPHQLSGGQRQRLGIARALCLGPRLLICDEPVSALDLSIQAQILNLLMDLQGEINIAYLFIAHDLSVVRYVSDAIAVMYLGKIVEMGDSESIYRFPTHPYTQALLSAAPRMPHETGPRDIDEIMLVGEIPAPTSPPSGCRFRTRCWKGEARCAEEEPLLIARASGQVSACHFASPIGRDRLGVPQ